MTQTNPAGATRETSTTPLNLNSIVNSVVEYEVDSGKLSATIPTVEDFNFLLRKNSELQNSINNVYEWLSLKDKITDTKLSDLSEIVDELDGISNLSSDIDVNDVLSDIYDLSAEIISEGLSNEQEILSELDNLLSAILSSSEASPRNQKTAFSRDYIGPFYEFYASKQHNPPVHPYKNIDLFSAINDIMNANFAFTYNDDSIDWPFFSDSSDDGRHSRFFYERAVFELKIGGALLNDDFIKLNPMTWYKYKDKVSNDYYKDAMVGEFVHNCQGDIDKINAIAERFLNEYKNNLKKYVRGDNCRGFEECRKFFDTFDRIDRMLYAVESFPTESTTYGWSSEDYAMYRICIRSGKHSKALKYQNKIIRAFAQLILRAIYRIVTLNKTWESRKKLIDFHNNKCHKQCYLETGDNSELCAPYIRTLSCDICGKTYRHCDLHDYDEDHDCDGDHGDPDEPSEGEDTVIIVKGYDPIGLTCDYDLTADYDLYSAGAARGQVDPYLSVYPSAPSAFEIIGTVQVPYNSDVYEESLPDISISNPFATRWGDKEENVKTSYAGYDQEFPFKANQPYMTIKGKYQYDFPLEVVLPTYDSTYVDSSDGESWIYVPNDPLSVALKRGTRLYSALSGDSKYCRVIGESIYNDSAIPFEDADFTDFATILYKTYYDSALGNYSNFAAFVQDFSERQFVIDDCILGNFTISNDSDKLSDHLDFSKPENWTFDLSSRAEYRKKIMPMMTPMTEIEVECYLPDNTTKIDRSLIYFTYNGAIDYASPSLLFFAPENNMLSNTWIRAYLGADYKLVKLNEMRNYMFSGPNDSNYYATENSSISAATPVYKIETNRFAMFDSLSVGTEKRTFTLSSEYVGNRIPILVYGVNDESMDNIIPNEYEISSSYPSLAMLFFNKNTDLSTAVVVPSDVESNISAFVEDAIDNIYTIIKSDRSWPEYAMVEILGFAEKGSNQFVSIDDTAGLQELFMKLGSFEIIDGLDVFVNNPFNQP